MKKYAVCLFVIGMVMVFISTAFALEFSEKGYTLSEFEKGWIEEIIKTENTGDEIVKIIVNVLQNTRRGNKIVQIVLIEADHDMTKITEVWTESDSLDPLQTIIEKAIEKKIKREAIQRVSKALEGEIPYMHGEHVIEPMIDPGKKYLLGWRIGASYTVYAWEKGDRIILDVWGKHKQIGRYDPPFTNALKIIPQKEEPGWEPSWKPKQKK